MSRSECAVREMWNTNYHRKYVGCGSNVIGLGHGLRTPPTSASAMTRRFECTFFNVDLLLTAAAYAQANRSRSERGTSLNH